MSLALTGRGSQGTTPTPHGTGSAGYFASDVGMAYYTMYQWNVIEIIKSLLYDKMEIS